MKAGSRVSEHSLNALRVVGEIVAEELDPSDPRLALIASLPRAWDKPDEARWEAARHMLDHDTYYAGEPLLRAPALGLLVGINDALCEFFSGSHVDPQRGVDRAHELRDMVQHLGRIVDETTKEHAT